MLKVEERNHSLDLLNNTIQEIEYLSRLELSFDVKVKLDSIHSNLTNLHFILSGFYKPVKENDILVSFVEDSLIGKSKITSDSFKDLGFKVD
jgi:hypothetical protein